MITILGGHVFPPPLPFHLRWRLRLLCLGLGLLGLGRTLLAGFVLAAAPATPMPLRLPRTIGRGRPQISLGLG
jgi:hypothetical protein